MHCEHFTPPHSPKPRERTISNVEHPAPIAYLTGEYPKVSHTFIQREIEALRKLGLPVQSFSIRRAQRSNVPADQALEEGHTFYVIENCRDLGRFMRAHLSCLASTPLTYLEALGLAWSLRQPGWKSALYQLFYFAEAGVLADEMRRRGVVHLHNHFGDSSCSVAMLASALCGITYSFTEHGPAIFFEAKSWHLDKKIARAKFVIAISHFCRSQLMLFSGPEHWSKISIVHCGVHPDRYGSGSSAAGKALLYVGRLEPVKGLPVLLEALARIKCRHPDIRLTVAGDGNSRAEIEANVQRLALTGEVELVGFKTQRDVAELMAKADMLVLPSFAEGVPVVLMEAMASSKPVIASRVAGVQELIHDGVNGYTVPPGDAALLAERIEHLIADPALRDRMGRAGRYKIEQDFNIEHEVRLLAQLFTSGAGQRIAAGVRVGECHFHEGAEHRLAAPSPEV